LVLQGLGRVPLHRVFTVNGFINNHTSMIVVVSVDSRGLVAAGW
jgi:hypothetical protein